MQCEHKACCCSSTVARIAELELENDALRRSLKNNDQLMTATRKDADEVSMTNIKLRREMASISSRLINIATFPGCV